ncbi:hypothetical protein ACQJBY_002613 [Aegilops geniculata]
MPSRSTASALTSGAGRRSASLSGCSPWWREAAGGGSDSSFFNKLDLVPDLEDGHRLVLFSCCCRGDGNGKRTRWGSRFSQLGWCIFSSVPGVELRRALLPPVSAASPVTFLSEWRPREAMASALASFLPPGLMPLGRQLFSFGMESSSSVFGRRWSGGGPVIPSGLVPGDGRTGSVLELTFGPNSTERAQRERLRDLAVFERVCSDPMRTSHSLAVKKFCRTISSTGIQASDIRPLPVLRETMDYLWHLLNSSEYPFEIVHDFIFDRTRSVRQDLSIQNLVNDQAIGIYEDVIKFHILSHQRLARSCQDSDASSLCYLNTEQMMKCLLSLFDMYHTIHKINSQSNKEAEYYSFFVLLHLGCKIPQMANSLSFWYSQLPASIVRSKEMIFARTILRCYHLGNFKRFFCMIADEATELQLCLVEPFLNEVRARALMYLNHSGYKLQHHPLTHLSDILMIEELELEDLCRICGLEISRSGDTKAFAPKQTTFSLPTPLSKSSAIYISREIKR